MTLPIGLRCVATNVVVLPYYLSLVITHSTDTFVFSIINTMSDHNSISLEASLELDNELYDDENKDELV
jgi:hypothetical protein